MGKWFDFPSAKSERVLTQLRGHALLRSDKGLGLKGDI